jgi:transaldolase
VTRLQDLYTQQNQSPWLDNLKRGWITSGDLERWVERGVRGITSNPSIFQKAMESGDAYDSQLRTLAAGQDPGHRQLLGLVTSDIRTRSASLRPVYDASGGEDGFVSVEVAPSLARDTEGHHPAAARHLNSDHRPAPTST